MKQNLYGTRLYINYSYLENNINYIKSHLENLKMIAMVKANAYGHGDIIISKKIEEFGIKYFGVADFEEGVRLKEHGLQSPIMVMNPGISSLQTIIEYNLEPVIYNNLLLDSLIKISKNKLGFIPIHIKFNTGMNRWGFDDPIPIISKLKKTNKIRIKSIYSHLSSSEHSKDDTFTKQQIDNLIEINLKFSKAFNYKIHTHIHNSSGLFRGAIMAPFFDKHKLFDYVRIGLSLYGVGQNNNLKPIGELKCSVSQIRTIFPGDSVGYSRLNTVKRKTRIGIIPFGYADGLQRHWGNGRLKFFYKGLLLPTVGNISMDSCAVDITNVDEIVEGDEIIYFGKKRSIIDLANELKTIPYEIIATLSRRIKRIYY